jgi:UTP:GlnB (protein PII) uridylyltransferase
LESTPAKRASEQLMQGYYRNAKAVTLLNTILMQNMGAALAPESEQIPQPIDDNFQVGRQPARHPRGKCLQPEPGPDFRQPSWSCRKTPTCTA